MSEIDVDNASLPSNDAADPIGLQRRKRPRLPYGTFNLIEDELVSTSQALSQIEAAQGRYHILRMAHAELGDDRMKRILEALHDKRLNPVSDAQSETDQEDIDGQAFTPEHWLSKVASLSRLSRLENKSAFDAFRVLELENNQLTSLCLPSIISYLTNNVTLHTLSLAGNNIGEDAAAFTKLAQTLGRSSLRRLCLSTNPILSESFVAFFDSIPANGTALECLELSWVLHEDTDTSQDDELAPARAAARFIADAQRCRTVKQLNLNGNEFGVRGSRTIVSAFVGNAPRPPVWGEEVESNFSRKPGPIGGATLFGSVSHAQLRHPNRSLEILDLVGNLENGVQVDYPIDYAKRLKDIRKRYASIPASDVDAIVTFFDQRARGRRWAGGSMNDNDIPLEVARQLVNLDVTLDEWESDFEEAAAVGAGWDASDWRVPTELQSSRNGLDAAKCRRSAVRVLAVARVIGCCAKRGSYPSEPSGFHRFLDLPPELRLAILRELDEDGALSERQLRSVISYACEPTTIGYGAQDFDWTQTIDSSEKELEEGASISLPPFPVPTWSWTECFEWRAPPREWAAEALDAYSCSSSYSFSGLNAVLFYGSDPSLYAFLKSTLTHRAES